VGALDAAERGTARTVLLGGEAGIGKTRLVRELAGHAAGRGVGVLAGGCRDLGQVPYTPVVDALRALTRTVGVDAVRDLAGGDADALGVLLPVLHRGGQPGAGAVSQGRIFEAVLRLVDRYAADTAAVLILEDLQWADQSTLDLLGFLFGVLSTEHVLLIGTYRSTDLTPGHPFRAALPALTRAATGGRLELTGLAGPEFDDLVTAVLGGPAGPELLTHLRGRCDGNPFFAEELLAAGPAGDGGLPVTVREHLLLRVDTLDPAGRDVLNLVSVAGHPVSHRFLGHARPVPPAALDAALRDCVSAQLLTVEQDGRGYAFRHALTREAVYGELLPGQRAGLHAAVAEALEQSQRWQLGGAAELAYHWWEADRPAEALRCCVRAAGDAAAVFGYTEAARFYEQAMTLWSRVPDPEAVAGLSYQDLLTQAADARRWTGDLTDAVRLIEQATAMLDSGTSPGRLAALLDRQGRYLWEMGDGPGSLAAYGKACHLLDGQPDTPGHAWVLAGHATALMQAGRHTAAIDQCRHALAVADRAGADDATGRALNTLGVCLALTGDPDRGIEALRRAADIAGRSGRLEDIDRAYANLTYVLESGGRLQEALAVAREGTTRTADLGVEITGGGVLLANTASVLVLLGRWEEAVRVADEALTRQLPAAFTHYLQLVTAEADIALGRLDAADALLAAVQDGAAGVPEPQVAGTLHALHAELAVWRRDYPAGLTAVNDGLHALDTAEEHALELRLCALGLRLAADQRAAQIPARRPAADDLDSRGRDYLGRAETIAGAGTPLLPEMTATTTLCRLEHDRLTGRHAAKEWAALAGTWQGLDRPYPAAYAWWRSAEDAITDHDPRTGTAALHKTHQLARRLAAAPLREEIEALAGRARIALDQPPTTRPAPPDPHGLTAREREVLEHLTQGHTNRQIARALFITEKTASVHVSNILAKLGVTNRGQAAALAHRATTIDPHPTPRH
ncbi:MAG TPA: AAA family ATPase, partial [Mycobacterium sp.]